jgi:hypothetical protein
LWRSPSPRQVSIDRSDRKSPKLPPILPENEPFVEQSTEQPSKTAQPEGLVQGHERFDASVSDLNFIRLLQERIAKLEHERKRVPKPHVEEEEASRVQVVYKVHCHQRNSATQFLDKPLEYGDELDHGFHLHGQKPFPRDLDLFIERQRDALSFMVYKELECCIPNLTPDEHQEISIRDLNIQDTKMPAIKETIRVTSKSLQDAFAFLRKRFPGELEYFPEFKIGSQISSPFLFYYCKRSFMMSMMSLDDLPQKHLSQVKMFCEHVEKSFGDEFAHVDTLMSEEKITAQYLPYLFVPGTVAILRTGKAYSGFEQTDWPRLKSRDSSIGPPGLTLVSGRPPLRAKKLSILGQYWHFDGSFSMNWKELDIDYGEPEPRVKSIRDLDVFPLRFAGFDIEDALRRRGSIFWHCRVRKFVSYNNRSDCFDNKVSSITFKYPFRKQLSIYNKWTSKSQILGTWSI